MIPALIIVVPVRLLWELLSVIARLVGAYVLRPIGWLLYTLLVRPLRWTLRVFVLLPLRWVGERLLVPLGRLVLRYVLRPVGIALAWAVSIALIPVVFAARWIGRGLAALWRALWPLLAAFGRFLAWTWHLAGLVLFHAARTAGAVRVARSGPAGSRRAGMGLGGDRTAGGALAAGERVGTRACDRTFGQQGARPGCKASLTPYS